MNHQGERCNFGDVLNGPTSTCSHTNGIFSFCLSNNQIPNSINNSIFRILYFFWKKNLYFFLNHKTGEGNVALARLHVPNTAWSRLRCHTAWQHHLLPGRWCNSEIPQIAPFLTCTRAVARPPRPTPAWQGHDPCPCSISMQEMKLAAQAGFYVLHVLATRGCFELYDNTGN